MTLPDVAAAIPERVRAHGLTTGHVRPLADFQGTKHGRRCSPKRAWQCVRLEVNPHHETKVILLDVDRPRGYPVRTTIGKDPTSGLTTYTYELRKPYDSLPTPSWVVINDMTGKFHVAYVLRDGIHHNRRSRKRPQAYLRSIKRRLREAWRADTDYNGILTRNPVEPGHDAHTVWLRREPYSLGELNEAVPRIEQGPRPSLRDPQADYSRNRELFLFCLKIAFRPSFARELLKGNVSTLDLVREHNEDVSETLGKPPIGKMAGDHPNELKWIAKSIEGFVIEQWSEEVFHDIQRKRWLKSAKVRLERRLDRNRLIWSLRRHMSVRAIAKHLQNSPTWASLAVGVRQVYRIIAHGRAGATWAKPRTTTADSLPTRRGASGGVGEGFPLILRSPSGEQPVMAHVTPSADHRAAQSTGQGDSPSQGRKWPLARSPGLRRGHSTTLHTPEHDQLHNEARKAASDVLRQARDLLRRLEAEGDTDGLARARKMLREQYGINIEEGESE